MRAELSRSVLLALTCASALAAAACASLAPEPDYPGIVVASELSGTRWVAQSIDGAPVAGRAPRLAFNPEDRLSGSGGCNTLSAVYEAQAGAIAVRGLGATEMECSDSAMRQEAAFLAVLEKAARYQRESARLVLADADGRNIVFAPA